MPILRSRALCAWLAAMTLAVCLPSLAAAAGATDEVQRDFQIPTGPLSQVITELARQAGREILFSTDLTRGKTSPGVHGRMSFERALQTVMEGTGLAYSESADGVLRLSPTDTASTSDSLEEVVVTAQKRSEPLIRVPISAAALTGEQLEARGIKDVADLARATPGVTFQGIDDSGDMNLAIRGIISAVGAPTTGVYLNDIPLQVRKDAAVWSDPFPKIFDLDRIEILRGPQGTFFGSGAEGGVVRFITPDVNLTKVAGFVRASVEHTEGGDPGGEIGAAFGTPLITDTLGVRASVWHQETGGYATRVDPVTGSRLGQNVNGTSTTVTHANLEYRPTDALVLTPSFFYQDEHDSDKGLFWERAGGDYTIASTMSSPHRDYMILPSLSVGYDFGAVTLKWISAYTYRQARFHYDSTQYEFASYAPTLTYLPSDPGYTVPADYRSGQNSYSQELRLTSQDGPDARFSWVGGLFFQHARESYDGQYGGDMNLLADYLSQSAGLGPNDAAGYFGEALVDGQYAYIRHSRDHVKETALFANATYRFVPELSLAAGVRFSRNSYSYHDFQDGPWGPGAPTTRSGSKSQPAVTPRVNLTYTPRADRMVYASLAKGYRMGGVNQPVPSNLCQADLASLGLSAAPDAYDSDSLWSYELGFKGRMFDRKVKVESSVFWIDWRQIQQSVYLANCGYNYIANLGRAVSRGADLQVEWALTDSLTLSGTAGYTDAFNAQTLLQDGTMLAKHGDPLATPAWTGAASLEYTFAAFSEGRGYVRLDGQYASAYKRMGSADVYGSDPLLRDAPAVTYLNGRIGVKLQSWNLALYGDNLANKHTSLYRYRDSLDTTPLALRDLRLRPRTVGLTATFSY